MVYKYTFVIPCLSALSFTEAFISTRIYSPSPSVIVTNDLWNTRRLLSSITSQDTEENKFSTFREAEMAGLKCMQEESYSTAILIFNQALKLPGSKVDVIRSKLTPGPSPVGGAILGGTEGKLVYTLDEFEYQAAYYNMACAYSQLQQPDEALACLEKAFQYGFDNYKTTVVDPDLKHIQGLEQFRLLLNKYDPKGTRSTQDKGNNGIFNPFRLWTK